MDENIKLDAVFDKNLNFLIGSGASVGLLPTLALNIRDAQGNRHTVETLAGDLPEDDPRRSALFMHYYLQCVLPAQKLTRESVAGIPEKQQVLVNYKTFISTLLQILLRRRQFDKRCNVFTTNYDPCFTLIADELIQGGTIDFVLNDGARGFTVRQLHARNFNTYLSQTGIFEREHVLIPQVNLVHLHGSVYWRRSASGISVEYAPLTGAGLVDQQLADLVAPFSAQLADAATTVENLVPPVFPNDADATFMEAYRKLPIVNPTKWKFHETVFEEQYYQTLRLLSYELEKPNSVLITFGFSFADEHILNLLKRSLTNPKLEVFVCCFDDRELERLRQHFASYRNVRFVGVPDGELDFSTFNDKVFSLGKFAPPEPVVNEVTAGG